MMMKIFLCLTISLQDVRNELIVDLHELLVDLLVLLTVPANKMIFVHRQPFLPERFHILLH